ncbi:MAG TPA: Gfo/Idh/MocA family oxidoreductase [Bacteroidales bacterium]|nr:Gfo/Idh/MocA family oxidoreductase [Bacteroidales bacterium]
MQKLNIGVMGCASIAERSMIPAIKAVHGLNLVAVASRSIEKAKMFAAKFNCEPIEGYTQLLERSDIDAVYMPLPTGLHHEWIIKSLKANKHVLAEKSIAANYASAMQMVELAKNKRLLLMENYMFQYHSQHQFVFDLLKKQEIGDLRIFRADFAFPPLPENNFRYDDEVGGGALMDCAGYTVRAVHFIMGDAFKVRAANLFFDHKSGTNIYGSAFLDHGNGVSAQLGFGMDNFYKCSYEIWGSKGMITAHRAYTPRPDYSPLVTVEKQGEKHEFQLKPDNHFIGSVKEFLRALSARDFSKHYHEILLQSKTLEDVRTLSAK